MINNDTISLLKECNAGAKMAVSSIDEVIDKVTSADLKDLLMESRKHHEKLGNQLHELLAKMGYEEKEPSVIAQGMSWIKTNMKLTMKESDTTIADLITDGCNMGVKSLNQYMNQYKNADNTSKDMCKRLADIEEQLCRDVRRFL